MEYEERDSREIWVKDANDFLEAIFMIMRPRDHKDWKASQEQLEEEMGDIDEVVYEGESEESYRLADIDMDEIMETLRGE